MPTLPKKTVERLSSYRRTLLNCLQKGKTHIFSYELAELHNITAEQVRRDIMFIGYSTTQKKGYQVSELIEVIGSILDHKTGLNVAIIGMGNLGNAITGYFAGKRPKLHIIASFDIDEKKINTIIHGLPCFHMNDLSSKIQELKIDIALLTVPGETAKETAEKLVNAGIKGILNFTSVPLNVSQQVYIEEYDMTTSLEKVAYYVKSNKNPE